ncbi:MAG: disulfide bond formation protein B [Flavobacteriaceae bacterium]|jgi:disulfide bond formation protein DsbB|nr:disulfide bond formation protein B [Flavobacteriaceae bacterium]MBT6704488.1 disulfide bond formation protein B [Flavobacteriaceae bacterium]MBT7243566.1 disulfide bond formation protein B [Flavobacteriaceae bacterium]
MKIAKYFNSACILLICIILVSALYFQFGLHEEPCPLCLLQRMAMMGVIIGLSLNIYFGFDTNHFSIVIISALIGALFSVRQIMLHIAPVAAGESTGYGSPIFGMHLYSWGALIFTASILGSALFLFSGDRFKPGLNHSVLKFEKYVVYLATLVVFVNVVAAFFECQFGPCCENGPCV